MLPEDLRYNIGEKYEEITVWTRADLAAADCFGVYCRLGEMKNYDAFKKYMEKL